MAMTHDASYRRILHKMGYYNYQQGLIYKHIDQEGGWNSHLRKCRNFIIKSLDFYKPSKITVLGSGWLLDLPLMEMVEKTDSIDLIDIVHPPEVISQISGLKNVYLKEEDITGGLITEIWNLAGRRYFFNKLKSLENIHIPEYKPQSDPGLVISLNILTQLESLPVELLRKKSKAGDESFIVLRKQIQEKHIDFLKKYDSVLITDISEVITDTAGKTTEELSVFGALPEAIIREEWSWYFEPVRSDYYRKKSVFKVAGLFIQAPFINIFP
jgi:hypothetical protein